MVNSHRVQCVFADQVGADIAKFAVGNFGRRGVRKGAPELSDQSFNHLTLHSNCYLAVGRQLNLKRKSERLPSQVLQLSRKVVLRLNESFEIWSYEAQTVTLNFSASL